MPSSGIPNVLSHTYESHDFDDVLKKLMMNYKKLIQERSLEEALCLMVSTQNYIQRSQWKKNPFLNVRAGDICFIDYGSAYQLEAGYQHFGLVVSESNGKLFVVPMSSNPKSFQVAYDEIDRPNGKPHLFRLKKSCGLNRDSTLFLNDAKFISPARIIDVVGHLSPVDIRFKKIQSRLFKTIFKSWNAIL